MQFSEKLAAERNECVSTL